ncbi:MAG: PspA/IM30 family protein [Candidatus Rifleibacteriota bacterium]
MMFKRLMNLIRGFFGLFIKGLESSNPEALIEAEKENLRNQISRFNENLANHAAFTERLMRQVKTLSAKEKELTAKITANIKVGNKKVAGQLALQLQTVKSQLEENQQQLEIADKTFKDLEKSRDVSVREAQAKIEKMQALVSEAEMLTAQAELQEMAKGMITGIGASGDTMNHLTEILNEKRDKAAGRVKVVKGSYDTAEIQMREGEQEALGDAALAEFMAMSGMDATVTPEDIEPIAPPQRGMGPMEKN